MYTYVRLHLHLVKLLVKLIQHMVDVGSIPYIIYVHIKTIWLLGASYIDSHVIIHMLILTLNSL